MEQYRTEDEQVEALKRWWEENGRSTLAAIVIAVAAGFGWQAWKGHDQSQRESASDAYQVMLKVASDVEPGEAQRQQAVELAEALKQDHGGSTYAQFAALHLARMAVEQGDLDEAEAQLRWVLGKADKGSDSAWVAQLRLARVLAARGEADQALAILAQGTDSPYSASYAMARGDVLLQAGRADEAREAYLAARMQAATNPGQVNLMTLEQKLQSLTPVPARDISAADAADASAATQPPADGSGAADGQSEAAAITEGAE